MGTFNTSSMYSLPTNNSLELTAGLPRALRPFGLRLTLALVFAIAAMWFFVVIAHHVARGATLETDHSILSFLARDHSPYWHESMLVVSILAGPYFQSAFWLGWVVWFIVKGRFLPDGISMILAGFGGLLLIVGLKYLFHRPRPQVIYDHLGYSFPSGHSFFALVIYGMAAYWFTRDRPESHKKPIWFCATMMILLVGFSRVALGEHYPSDVIAGFALGLPWLWACLALPATFHREGRDLSVGEAASRSEITLGH